MIISFPLEGLNASGGIRVVTSIANALAARGHEVRVYVPRYAAAPTHPLSPYLRVVPLGGTTRSILSKSAYLARLAVVAARDADIIVATGYKTPFVCALARAIALNQKAALVYLVQGLEEHTHAAGTSHLRSRMLSTLARASMRIRAHHVVVSDWLRDTLGLGSATVIPNGVCAETFHPRGRPQRQQKICIGIVGSSAPMKGYEDLISAISRLAPDMRSSLKVLVVGSDRLGWVDSVETEFMQPNDDVGMRNFYQACDIFVFPSHIEGFGLPPLEAMACGTPTVVAQCGGVGQFASASNCLLYEPGDTSGLASAIATLASDPELRRQLADAGIRTAARFTMSRMLASHVRFFETLA